MTEARDPATPRSFDTAWEELRQQAPGYAYVSSAERRADGVVLTLKYSTGKPLDVAIPFPDSSTERAAPDGMQKILAVRIVNGEALSCSVVGITRSGPRRALISVEMAIAFTLKGYHAVVLSGGPHEREEHGATRSTTCR